MLCNFSVRMLKYFLKNWKKKLPSKNWKNHPKKLHYCDNWDFFFFAAHCPKHPRTSFLFYRFFYPIVSAKVSGGNHSKATKHTAQLSEIGLKIPVTYQLHISYFLTQNSLLSPQSSIHDNKEFSKIAKMGLFYLCMKIKKMLDQMYSFDLVNNSLLWFFS